MKVTPSILENHDTFFSTSLRSVPRGGVRMVRQDHEDAECHESSDSWQEKDQVLLLNPKDSSRARRCRTSSRLAVR